MAMIYIEARLQDDIELLDLPKAQQQLQEELSKPGLVFKVGENLLADQRYASIALRGNYENASNVLHSLVVAEYIGPVRDVSLYSTDDTQIRVQMYKLCSSDDDKNIIPHGETTYMPHVSFHEIWDDLVFSTDIKGELIATMINILRFSKRASQKRAVMNPLILLHGPPGSGKTSLGQGLAQKVSIRLKDTYKATRLIQIRTATLLSKFYSESAKQVDEIFTTIERACDEDHQQFVCVLIDEVESIASSREASMHGEAQDSLRATNSLLTGLDRTSKKSNVVILCTTNMLESLDSAFLDRCSIRIPVLAPSPMIQYEILRNRMHGLITDQLISPGCDIPCYRDAVLEYDMYPTRTEFEGSLYGRQLLRIVEQINERGDIVSGRLLTQLPEMAIMRCLRATECDLNMVYGFMETCLRDASAASVPAATKEKRKRERMQEKQDDVDWALAILEKLATTLSEANNKRSKVRY